MRKYYLQLTIAVLVMLSTFPLQESYSQEPEVEYIECGVNEVIPGTIILFRLWYLIEDREYGIVIPQSKRVLFALKPVASYIHYDFTTILEYEDITEGKRDDYIIVELWRIPNGSIENKIVCDQYYLLVIYPDGPGFSPRDMLFIVVLLIVTFCLGAIIHGLIKTYKERRQTKS